ncbi:MAG: hypothetical protein ABL866_15520 [Devosia sp.]
MTGYYISQRQADAHDAVTPRLRALLQSIDTIARRRPELPVPGDLIVVVREVLRGVMRVVSREKAAPRFLPLHAGLTYGGLDARLRFAHEALFAFKKDYWFFVPALGEHCWRTEDWRDVDLSAAPRPREDDEDDDDEYEDDDADDEYEDEDDGDFDGNRGANASSASFF